MAENEILVLSDKTKIPTDEYIFSIIGDKKTLWLAIMDHVSENYNDAVGAWNFYNDGKQWLFKMVRKKKTIFWAAILTDTFRITFYFGDKAEPALLSSDLPRGIKDGFLSAKRYGLIRAITIKVRDNDDVDNILKIITLKVRF